MSIRNQNWYDLQATRRYPLDESSTGVDDTGALFRDSVLADCHLRFPDTLGRYAYIQGITVTPTLVTIVFGAGNHPRDTNGPSIAALSLRQPVAQNVNHELSPLQPGVAGWAVLGSGITEPLNARYTTLQQTIISHRCARPYRPIPVTSFGKLSLATSLQGVVTLTGQAPVTATAKEFQLDGETIKAIVFQLEGELQTFNPLAFFQGPCGQRPESGTCPKPAIETINGIAPDCDGNINIVFEGLAAYPYVSCGGVDVIADIGLSEACAQGEPRSRRLTQDNCYPSQSLAAGDDQTWQPPLPPPVVESSESLPAEVWPSTCAALPLCRDFGDGLADDFVTKEGLFVFEAHIAPSACADESASSETAAFVEKFTYTSANIVGRNIALFKNCASDWALNKTVSVELNLSGATNSRNGGIVLNYMRGNPALRMPTTYLVASLNFNLGAVQLLRWNGSRFVVEYSSNFPTYIDKWYTLSARPFVTGSTVAVEVSAEPLDGSVPPLSFTVPSVTYGDPIGQAGLFSDRGYTHFNKFRIAN